MRYSVRWRPEAEDMLVKLWNAASDSAEIAHAASEINRILENEPTSAGESRGGSRRLMFVPPLAARFIISPQGMLVIVTSVWSTRRERK